VGGEGIDLNTLESLEGVVAGGQHQQGEVIEECRTGEDAEKSRDCRLIGTVNSIQASWSEALEGYRPAVTVFFSDSTNTGCGVATADVGPFYCPADQKVYVDLGFFQELQARFGAGGGPFAEAYVLAHEYGHHVQTVLGTEPQVRRQQQRDPGNANRYSVLLELQADCYSGVWAKHATETTDAGGQAIFTRITDQDIAEGLAAAAAVGDDAIQKKAGGRIDESQFTHGTSEQRQKWFRQGFDTGDPKTCDTFGNPV